MDKGNKKIASTYKYIDSDKVDNYIRVNKVNQCQLTENIGVSRGYLREAIKRGNAQKATWGLVCQQLGVPADYFDYTPLVPEKKTEAEPEKIVEDPIRELLVSILMTQKKQEALLLDIASSFKNAWS